TTGVEAGRTVTLTISDSSQGTPDVIAIATVEADGSWSASAPVNLSGLLDGALTVKADVSSAAGTPASATESVIKDAAAPTQSVSFTTVTDDTGDSATDFNTSDQTLRFDGTLSTALGNGEKLQISLDGGASWLDVSNVSGTNWFYDNTANLMAAGTHTLQARVIDTVGNTGATGSKQLVIDTEGPDSSGVTLTIDPITGDDIINAGEAAGDVTISGTIANLPADAASRALVVTVGGSGYTATISGNNWSVTVPGSVMASDAAVDATLTLTDAAGNSSTAEASRDYTVVTTIPTISITTPIADDGYVSASEQNGVTLAGKTTGVEAGRTVTLTIGNGGSGASDVIVSATVQADGSWSTSAPVNLSGLLDGALTVKADVSSAAGTPASATASVIKDAAAPTQSVSFTTVTDDSGGSATDFITNDQTLRFDGALSAPLGNGEKLQLSLDGGASWLDAGVSGTSWFYDNTANVMAAGSYTLQARVIDTAGNTSATASKQLLIDTEGADKTATLTAITDDTGESSTDFVTSDATLTFSGTLSQAIAAGETVQIAIDGGPWLDANATGATWNYAANALTEGVHEIQTRVIDLAGNPGAVVNAQIEIDRTAPSQTVSIDAISDDLGVAADDFITADSTLIFSGALSQELGAGEKVQLSLDGGATWREATTIGLAWTYDNSANPLAAGVYDIQARVIDLAGNTGAASSRQLEIDTTPPPHATTTTTVVLQDDTTHGLPTAGNGYASPSTATDNDLITRDREGLTVTGVLSKALAAGEILQISTDGGQTWATALSGSGVNWSHEIAAGAVTEGAHSFDFRIIDLAGNVGSSTAALPPRTVIVDHTGPADITVAPIVPDTPLVAGSAFTVAGSGGAAGDYVALIQDANFNGVYEENIDRVLGWTEVGSSGGAWSFSATAEAGLTNLAFIAFDAAGNQSRLGPVTTVAATESTAIINTTWGSGDAGRGGHAETGSMAISRTGGWLFFQPTSDYGGNLYTQQQTGWDNITSSPLPQTINYSNDYGKTYTGSTFADIDRNGYIDMVNTPSDFSSHDFNIYYQSASGWTQARVDVGAAVHMGATIAYDKEGDGWLDVVSADSQADSITFIYNNAGALTPANGNGRPTNSANGNSFTTAQGAIMKGASTVDIDNDGKVDIAGHIGSSNSQNLGVYYDYQPGSSATAGSFSMKYINTVLRNDGGDPDYNDIEPKESWADFNNDGMMDLFLSRGAAINASTGAFVQSTGTSGNSNESRILYNNGGSLDSAAGSFTRFNDNHDGVLSFAVDWNMDGQIDVIEAPKALSSDDGGNTPATSHSSDILLWTGSGISGGKASFAGSTLGTQGGVIGAMAADINWDGSTDLIMMTTGTTKVLLNANVARDGTSLHLRIVDQAGVNIFYGNTVNLYDSHGNRVATQMINPQGSATDSSGLVSFYGLDASETYSVQLLRVTNGEVNHTGASGAAGDFTEATVNETWGGLKAGSAHDAYMLTAEQNSGVSRAVNDSTQFGSGYNDSFFSSAGNDSFDGAGGWARDFGAGSQWVSNGGQDYVDYSHVAGPVTVNLATGTATGDGNDTLTNIEGLIGTQSGDTFTGSAVDNFFDGRGGDDVFNLANGGHTTLEYGLLNPSDPTGGNGHDTVSGFKVGEVKTDANADLIDLSRLFAGTAGLPVLSGYVDSDGVFKLDVATDPNGGEPGGISDFLRVTASGGNTTIEVDLTGGGNSFAPLLTLTGVTTTLEELVQNHQIIVGNGAQGLSGASAPLAASVVIDGSSGVDVFADGGNASVALNGGDGDDRFLIGNAGTAVNGGEGFDALRVVGQGLSLNLARITGIEQVDLGADGSNSLAIRLADVLRMPDATPKTLLVTGDASASVTLAAADGFVRAAGGSEMHDGMAFDVYQAGVGDGVATLLLQQGVHMQQVP
ncbi:MAG: Ig-like domain-containing protein, partial [Azonexus sp.]|nr:Ig-like domain-containing protein [Azonexus sp.]